MAAVRVVLVEPRYEGNVGSVARAMRNFGLSDLVLVRPCAIGEEARRYSMHGLPVLEGARTVDAFEDAVAGADLVVGTSAVTSANEKRFARRAITSRDFADRAQEYSGTVALAFGREDDGLRDGEIRACDLLVTIPASPEYPTLNLAHTAVILFYELAPGLPIESAEAGAMEREKLHEAFAALMRATEYPEHKFERTQVMFRRLLGRSMPTAWEFHALMGVYTRATRRIERLEAR